MFESLNQEEGNQEKMRHLEIKLEKLEDEILKSKKNEITLQREILREKQKNLSSPSNKTFRFQKKIEPLQTINEYEQNYRLFLTPNNSIAQKRNFKNKENEVNQFSFNTPIKQIGVKSFWLELHENYNKLKVEKNELEENVSRLKEGTIEILVEKEKIINELSSKIDILEDNLTKKETEENESSLIIDSTKNDEIQRLIEENLSLKQKYCELYEESNIQIENLNEESNQERIRFENRCAELQNISNQDKISHLSKQIEEFQENDLKLMSEIKSKDKIISAFERKVRNLENEIVELEKQMEINEYKYTLKIKDFQENSFKKDNHEIIFKQKEDEILNLKEEMLALQREINELNDENQDLSDEKESFQIVINDLRQSYEQNLKTMEETIKSSKSDYYEEARQYQTEINALQEKLSECLATMNQYEIENCNNDKSMLNDFMESNLSPRFSPSHFNENFEMKNADRSGKRIEGNNNERFPNYDVEKLMEHIIKSDMKWAEENNTLREELKILEKITVQTKLEFAQTLADKDYYQMRYNNLMIYLKQNENEHYKNQVLREKGEKKASFLGNLMKKIWNN